MLTVLLLWKECKLSSYGAAVNEGVEEEERRKWVLEVGESQTGVHRCSSRAYEGTEQVISGDHGLDGPRHCLDRSAWD
jgi:hypothetical protein